MESVKMDSVNQSPIRVPSLQVDLVSDDDGKSDLSSPDQSESTDFGFRDRNPIPISIQNPNPNQSSISYLKPPPTCYTLPKRGLVILSPNIPNKR
jgi:hypothetical protein